MESLSSFGRRHGVTRQAVAKAAMYGRFSEAAVARVGGRWVILDPALADYEWDANCNPMMRPSWPLRQMR